MSLWRHPERRQLQPLRFNSLGKSEENLCRFAAADAVGEARLWYLIYPGAEGSRTEWLARGAHCTFKLDASKFVSYHNYASSLPLLSDVDRNDQATTYESIALTLAEKVQLDIQDFKTCLHADETLARLKMVRDLVTEQDISTRPAFFINQRQVMVADPTDITSTFSLILSERDRLSPYLP
jgi:hypothetical protein